MIDSTYLGAAGATADFSGNDVAGLPGRVVNVAVRWTPARVNWLFAEVGAQHNSDYFADDRNAVEVPGFTVFRASMGAEKAMVGGIIVKATLAVENLTDAKYVGSAFINPDYTGPDPMVYEAGLPRAVVFQLGFRRAR